MMAEVYRFLTIILNFFPEDPFTAVIAELGPMEYLGYLNYFIPVSELVRITGLWAGCMVSAKAALFVYHLFLRKV